MKEKPMAHIADLKKIVAKQINHENFAPYGQLITASEDGKNFDQTDAKLDLTKGIPRFYIMRLKNRGIKFHKITRHELCTQCLGSLEGKDWFLAVAPPNHEPKPDIDKLQVFHIPGNCFVKLEMGTWHAGPYFKHSEVDFYNLELSDTNESDHFAFDFESEVGLKFEITQ